MIIKVPKWDATLLNSQKAQVFDMIEQAEIDPFLFKWRVRNHTINPVRADNFSILVLKERPEFFFEFQVFAENYQARCSPGRGTRQSDFAIGPWSNVLPHVFAWADAVGLS